MTFMEIAINLDTFYHRRYKLQGSQTVENLTGEVNQFLRQKIFRIRCDLFHNPVSVTN